MKKGIIFTVAFLLLVISIVTYFVWYKPKVQIVRENIETRSSLINESNFFFWDVADNVSIDYINASHYDFVILSPDKIKSLATEAIQKNIIIDYSQNININELKDNQELNKHYGIIGVLVPISEINKNVNQIKSTCMPWGCTINYLTQFFLLWDEEPSKQLIDLIDKHPENFSIIAENIITENKEITTPSNIKLFSVENLTGKPSIDNTELWKDIGNIVKNADQNKYGYQLVFDKDNKYPTLSQVPKASVELINDTVPVFKWNIIAPHKGVSQQSYSMSINSKDTDWSQYFFNYPVEVHLEDDPINLMYTTGRTPSSMTSAEIIPENEVIGTEFSMMLQIWTLVSFEGYDTFETVPVYPTFLTFDFDFLNYQKNGTNNNFKSIAWIPEWGIEEGLNTLRSTPNQYTTVSPVWFWPKSDGTLRTLQSYNNQDLIQFGRSNNIAIIPSIQIENDDVEVVSSLLNESVDKHIDSIVDVVVQNDYDGIDLDYEITYQKDKEALIGFLRKLADKLHENGKILSFTVLPQWGDNITYGFRPETHMAQDWKQIGEIVDEFRIMSYDYRTRSNAIPGAIAPYAWYLAILRYAQQNVPNEKIIMGIPLYGVDWKLISNNEISLNSYTTGQSLYNDINSLLTSSFKRREQLVDGGLSLNPLGAYSRNAYSGFYRNSNDWNQEQIQVYVNNGWRFTSYLNKNNVNQRILTAKDAGIGGYAVWRLISY